mgnify:FL=1
MNHPKRSAISLQQAVDGAPTLARLSALAAESAARLRSVQPLLAPALRDALRPGAIDGDEWCVLVPHNAAAAKLRQMVPALLTHLRAEGRAISAIRIRVQRP